MDHLSLARTHIQLAIQQVLEARYRLVLAGQPGPVIEESSRFERELAAYWRSLSRAI